MSQSITKIISFILSFCLIFEQSVFAQAIDLSHYFVHGSIQKIPQTDKFRPLHLRYISYDNQANDFKILLDKGDFFNQKTKKPKNEKTFELSNSPNSSTPKLEEATQELMKYFFIGLSLPNEKFWVNLRPDSPDNILDPDLEKTDIGRIFLEADLQLKKDTSGMTSPQNPEGKVYWDKLYKKAGELFGTENITIPTITRPWIVPNEIIIREAPDNAYIYKATLKVMLEEDYLRGMKDEGRGTRINYTFNDPRLKELNQYSTQLIKETIIPKLTYAVNTAKRYAPLRQVYYSLILAQWFKQKYGPGSAVPGLRSEGNSYIKLIDSGNLANLTSKEPYDKQTYFQQYQKSFKGGEYNLQEPVYAPMGQSIRHYTSGGGRFEDLLNPQTTTFIAGSSGSPLLGKRNNFFKKIILPWLLGISIGASVYLTGMPSAKGKEIVENVNNQSGTSSQRMELNNKPIYDYRESVVSIIDKGENKIKNFIKKQQNSFWLVITEIITGIVAIGTSLVILFKRIIRNRKMAQGAHSVNNFVPDENQDKQAVEMVYSVLNNGTYKEYLPQEGENEGFERLKDFTLRHYFSSHVVSYFDEFEADNNHPFRDLLIGSWRTGNIDLDFASIVIIDSYLKRESEGRIDKPFFLEELPVEVLMTLAKDKTRGVGDVISAVIEDPHSYYKLKYIANPLFEDYCLRIKGYFEKELAKRISEKDIYSWLRNLIKTVLDELNTDYRIQAIEFRDIYSGINKLQESFFYERIKKIKDDALLGKLNILEDIVKKIDKKFGEAPDETVIYPVFQKYYAGLGKIFLSLLEHQDKDKQFCFLRFFTHQDYSYKHVKRFLEGMSSDEVSGIINCFKLNDTYRDRISWLNGAHAVFYKSITLGQKIDREFFQSIAMNIFFMSNGADDLRRRLNNFLQEVSSRELERFRGEDIPGIDDVLRSKEDAGADIAMFYHGIKKILLELLRQKDLVLVLSLLRHFVSWAQDDYYQDFQDVYKELKYCFDANPQVVESELSTIVDILEMRMKPGKEEELDKIIEVFNPDILLFSQNIRKFISDFNAESLMLELIVTGSLNSALKEDRGDILKAIKSSPEYLRKFISLIGWRNFVDQSEKLLEELNPVLTGKGVGKILFGLEASGSFLIEYVLYGYLNNVFLEANGSLYKFVELFFYDKTIDLNLKRTFFELDLSETVIAKALGVNIKIARHIKQRINGIGVIIEKLADQDFKAAINKIAYNLNREVTLSPKDMRLDEDAETSLFDELFFIPHGIENVRRIFDEYFYNDPAGYQIPIPKLITLLGYLKIDDLEDLIKGIVEDPKQSLEEITVRNNVSFNEGNREAVVKELKWRLSNLFVLQDKIKDLNRLSAGIVKQGKDMRALINLLQKIHENNKIADLVGIAMDYGISFEDIFQFKIESIQQSFKENLIVSVLQQIDGIDDAQIPDKAGFYKMLNLLFSSQPTAIRQRIYLKLFLSLAGVDFKAFWRAIERLGKDDSVKIDAKFVLLRRFLVENKDIVTRNQELKQCLFEIGGLQNEDLQEAAFSGLRELFMNRKMPLLEGGLIRESMRQLSDIIALPGIKMRLPHILFEFLLRLNMDAKEEFEAGGVFEKIRELIEAMNVSRVWNGGLSEVKSALFSRIVAFAVMQYSDKGMVFARIIKIISDKYLINTNVNSFVSELKRCLNNYEEIVKKKDINEELKALGGSILKGILEGIIKEAEINAFLSAADNLYVDNLMLWFGKKLMIKDDKTFLNALYSYAKENPRFKWRDYENKNIFELITGFLEKISDEEIYRNLYDALNAEVKGDFKPWRYQSQDYIKTIDEIIMLEAGKLSMEDQAKLQDAISKADGKTIYEVLQGIDGLEGLKSGIERIKKWESALAYVFTNDKQEEMTVEFTDDFYKLFTIGHTDPRIFTACQNCSYSSDLNRGLTGYLVNGTNKAVVVYGKNGELLSRMIVRLKIVKDGKDRKYPVIFIEDSNSYGSEAKDKLYAVLDILSRRTGLPIISSNHYGEKGKYKFVLFKGRSGFDYSDILVDEKIEARITAGLYNQVKPEMLTPALELSLAPVVNDSELEIAERYGLSVEGTGQLSSPIISESNELQDNKGGIAFNALPIQTEFVASSALRALPGGRAFNGDLDEEWGNIQSVFNAGIRPSIQRLSEYTAAAAASPLAEDKIDQVRVMLADILRRDEESQKLAPAEESCKQLLRVLESG